MYMDIYVQGKQTTTKEIYLMTKHVQDILCTGYLCTLHNLKWIICDICVQHIHVQDIYVRDIYVWDIYVQDIYVQDIYVQDIYVWGGNFDIWFRKTFLASINLR